MTSTPNYPVQKQPLHVPPLEEVAQAFRSSLASNFSEVSVEVVDCPDLSKAPFGLAGQGLTGNETIFEVGGTQNLVPLVNRSKLYNVRDLAAVGEIEPAFVIGAAAAPFPWVGVNAEGIINIKLQNGEVDQQSRISKVEGNDEHMVVQVPPSTETRIALLGNLFGSNGKPGQVIRVHVKKRIGKKNFVEALRNAIEEKYGHKQLVGIGGAFLIAEGKVKQHVMRDFSKTPLDDQEAIDSWLKFYEMSSPLVAVGTFVSNDGGDLDLRVQHFHSFSDHGEAGHYHYDTTRESVEYLGYFNVGRTILRVDKPEASHKYGRD